MGVYDTTIPKPQGPAAKPANKGIKDSVDNIDSILNKMNADHPGDIIADILHWCDKYNEDWDNLVYIGTQYYLEENNG
tara:strand:- start:66 stop:299 length:234 start_codon:yes stop_codon:yes gene_type:complete